jgi:hypothetical protein
MRRTIWLPALAVCVAATAYGALAPARGAPGHRSRSYQRDAAAPRPQAVPADARRPRLHVARELGDSLAFAFVEDLSLLDGKLLVLDISARHPLTVVDPVGGRVERAYGLRGSGPGEFLWAKGAEPAGQGRVWLNDLQAGRMTLYDTSPPGGATVRTLRTPVGLFHPIHLGDTLVSNGLFAGEILRFFVERGGELREVRRAVPTPFGREAPDVAMILNRTTLAARPAGDRLVGAYFYANRIDFYDRHGRTTAVAAGPRDFAPTYRTVPDPREKMIRWVPTRETRYGYVDVAATQERVYALFAGRSSGDTGHDAFDGIEVHVFDWSGRLLDVMPLDVPVTRIAVDAAAHTVYGIRRDPYPIVVQFAALPLDVL